MLNFRSAAGLIALASILSLPAAAQRQARTPTPNDTLKSPEVLPDRQVTFRIYAPKASEVAITGDWITHGRAKAGPLEKADDGVWSITLGPFVPDFYSYSFSVDGVRTLDPKNAWVKPGVTSLSNMFEVPGDDAAYEETRPVPHGEVRIVWYQSSTLDTMRSMHVYTPPGYESGNAKYPVFYLLHGAGDDDSGWSTIGRAGFILDNLLAEKKAKPMIVVMPNGSMPPSDKGPAFQAGRFADELLKNVIPYVEKNYRVIANRDNRAIAGLSMGGAQTLRVLPSNLDKFAYAGVWSMGVGRESTAGFEQDNAAFLDNASKTNKELKVFWLAVGENDALVGESAKNLDQLLTAKGIQHEFHVTEGGHTWINWRHYLHDYAQLLFR
ncbi:MAG: esterase [Acidobacteriia bacterium]|nr:esterase [Terriglobia bacterium]